MASSLRWILLLAVTLSCAHSPFRSTALERYQDAHPGWHPSFPRPGIDLDETVASVYANTPSAEAPRIVAVLDVAVLQTAPVERELEAQALEPAAGNADYLVVVERRCRLTDIAPRNPSVSMTVTSETVSWYRLRANRLVSWSHGVYTPSCASVAETGPDLGDDRPIVFQSLASLRPDFFARPAPREIFSPVYESDCPELYGYAKELRAAIRARRATEVNEDLTATLVLSKDGSLQVARVRPMRARFISQLTTDVALVSDAPDRPVAPTCALGSLLDLEIPR